MKTVEETENNDDGTDNHHNKKNEKFKKKRKRKRIQVSLKDVFLIDQEAIPHICILTTTTYHSSRSN